MPKRKITTKEKESTTVSDDLNTSKKSKSTEKLNSKMKVPNVAIIQGLAAVLEKAKTMPLIRGSWNITDGINHLVKCNTNFENVIAKYEIPSLYDNTDENDTFMINKNYFHALCKSIIYQQLATNAANSIFSKFINAVNDKVDILSPADVLNAKFEVSIIEGKKKVLVNGIVPGLSESKSNYLIDLALHFNDTNKLKNVDLDLLSDEELYNKLISVKGLGPWSVHMFMMFKLLRSDVLPIGDLGFRRGLCNFHGLPTNTYESTKKQSEIIELCKSWSPYSSLGSMYMYEISNDLMKK